MSLQDTCCLADIRWELQPTAERKNSSRVPSTCRKANKTKLQPLKTVSVLFWRCQVLFAADVGAGDRFLSSNF